MTIGLPITARQLQCTCTTYRARVQKRVFWTVQCVKATAAIPDNPFHLRKIQTIQAILSPPPFTLTQGHGLSVWVSEQTFYFFHLLLQSAENNSLWDSCQIAL